LAENQDLLRSLEQLKRERERIDEVILILEKLASGSKKQRGRPPSWLAELRTRKQSVAEKPANEPAAEPGV
jgi:hypothetical protein